MNKYFFSTLVLITFFSAYSIKAQNTFTQVHQLLQTKCSGSGCHNGSTATFNVTLSESALYSALVNAAPVNPAAAAKGDKLIDPGYVDRSFLLRKLSHNLNPHLALQQPQEGSYMPVSSPQLPMKEFELIRQWILAGAPQTGNVVDTAIINMYYSGKGIDNTYPVHNPPAPGEGFQIYVGKIFIAPNTETYLYIKHKPRFTAHTEISRITTIMPPSAHHFIILKFIPGGSGGYREGLRPEEENSHADNQYGIGTGSNVWDYTLPQGTAYLWEQNTVLDLNLHIFNTHADTVLATDLYINVFTQPHGTANSYMMVRNFPNFDLSVPQDSLEHTFTLVANDTTETKMWKIWQLYTHTHKYGTDYDVYIRNEDGSTGTQVYEGFYSYEQNFMVGFYRTGVDVTIRYFPDNALLEVDPRLGFIHIAKFKNTNGPDPVNWGLTSYDEMMNVGFQYVYGDDLEPASVQNKKAENIRLNVFPNPASNMISLNYVLQQPADVQVELVNILSEKTVLLNRQNKTAGNYLEEIELGNSFASGVYLLTFHAANETVIRRIVIE
jgi:hypothetical protein